MYGHRQVYTCGKHLKIALGSYPVRMCTRLEAFMISDKETILAATTENKNDNSATPLPQLLANNNNVQTEVPCGQKTPMVIYAIVQITLELDECNTLWGEPL